MCPGCGHLRSESMDPDHQGEYIATPLECFACSTASRSTATWKPEELRGIYVATKLPDDGGR